MHQSAHLFRDSCLPSSSGHLSPPPPPPAHAAPGFPLHSDPHEQGPSEQLTARYMRRIYRYHVLCFLD